MFLESARDMDHDEEDAMSSSEERKQARLARVAAKKRRPTLRNPLAKKATAKESKSNTGRSAASTCGVYAREWLTVDGGALPSQRWQHAWQCSAVVRTHPVPLRRRSAELWPKDLRREICFLGRAGSVTVFTCFVELAPWWLAK